MRFAEEGPALVLVYAGNQREAVLVHEHDGGPAYMGPFLRKAIQYAKTHYDSGQIVDVLLSETETRKVEERMAVDTVQTRGIQHVYYLTYTWESRTGRKAYRLYAKHFKSPYYADLKALPVVRTDIPEDSETLV